MPSSVMTVESTSKHTASALARADMAFSMLFPIKLDCLDGGKEDRMVDPSNEENDILGIVNCRGFGFVFVRG